MFRIILFLLGFGLAIIGFMYIIAYLNYLTIGYTFFDYLKYCVTRIECFQAFLGLIFIMLAIFSKGKG